MADRGRLFYDSDGKLRQVDPTANISGEPAEADLEPVEFVAASMTELTGGVTGSLAVGKIFGERIESQSPSGVSTVEFTSGIGANYDRYIFEITDIVPSSDGSVLHIQVSTDGGSNWKSGASDYSYASQIVESAGTSPISSNNGASEMRVNGQRGIGSEAGEGATGYVRFSQPTNGGLVQLFQWEFAMIGDTGSTGILNGAGSYDTAEAIDAIRFKFSSGNIESGEIDLYGVMS